MFMREILAEENITFMITTPDGFGKTKNLKLLKSFLEIEVNEKGVRKPKLISEIKNYNMFVNNSYRITECKHIMDDYFGKYPVISLSFECFSVIGELEDAVKLYKRAVHSAYKDHEYLSRSERLSANERKLVRFWSDDHNYHTMTRYQVVTGVTELARLVRRHHGTRVWVLLDDYEAVVRAALEEAVTCDALSHVVRLTCRLVSHACSGDSVLGSVVTGVLPLSPVMEHTRVCTFLEDHVLSEYFGLTAVEVEKVLGDVEEKHTQIEEIKNKYVYKTKQGREIYKYKILKLLNRDTSQKNVPHISRISDFTTVYKLPQIKETMQSLIKGNPVVFNCTGVFTPEDLMELRTVLKGDSTMTSRAYDLWLSYLLHLGHLRRSPKDNEEAGAADSSWVIAND